MYCNARVAVVVPAHNESALIGRVLERMPSFVDQVVVVDDASDDQTAAIVARFTDPRIRLLRLSTNRGVGAAIVAGYRVAQQLAVDVVAVMAGDDQMHPDDLEALIRPVVLGECHYAKGDRLHHPLAGAMPFSRRIGSVVLSWMTRHAIGLRQLSDSQCGYTAIAAEALSWIDLDAVWPRFGYPNDLLGHLVSAGLATRDVVVRPVYKGEKSELRPWHLIRIALLVCRAGLRVRTHNPKSRKMPDCLGAVE